MNPQQNAKSDARCAHLTSFYVHIRPRIDPRASDDLSRRGKQEK